jgi:hypothetical protein
MCKQGKKVECCWEAKRCENSLVAPFYRLSIVFFSAMKNKVAMKMTMRIFSPEETRTRWFPAFSRVSTCILFLLWAAVLHFSESKIDIFTNFQEPKWKYPRKVSEYL